jgi:predicted phosphodiesterase
MRFAVFSDVHGNLEAFEVVLKDIKKVGADRRVNLGDLVGYGASPEEVILLNREHIDVTVLGNHDAAVAGKVFYESWREEAETRFFRCTKCKHTWREYK